MNQPAATSLEWATFVQALQRGMRKPAVCVVASLLAATTIAFLLVWVRGIPAPAIHDEFAYLLGADTFVSGRLTNPPHPMWQHFESFHVIQQPTYTCKYPPAQPLVLAAGQWLGHPIIGVCLATGCSVAALVWMLTGWLPRKYNWLIFLFSVLHPGIQIAWGQSYWGGAVALTGAALLLGSLIRLSSKLEIRYALVAAFGTLLLANSRPFEGAVLAATVGLTLIWRFRKNPRWQLMPFLGRVILPGLTVFSVGVGGMLCYNQAVTGSALKMPYQVHEATYGWNPLFIWQTAGEKPDYRHPVMARFFETDKQSIDAKFGSLGAVLGNKASSSLTMVKFFCGGTTLLAFLGLPWLWRKPRYQLAIIMVLPVFLASMATPWAWARYCAPAAPLLIVLLFASWIEIWKRTYRIPALRLLLLILLPAYHLIWATSFYRAYDQMYSASWGKQRVAVERRLLEDSGRDLVLVRYSDRHNTNAEWVYNLADIDNAPIVWAREINPTQRSELIQYFDDRNVWTVDADSDPPNLRRFDPSENKIEQPTCKPNSGETNDEITQ